jgi:hypothetical protein
MDEPLLLLVLPVGGLACIMPDVRGGGCWPPTNMPLLGGGCGGEEEDVHGFEKAGGW